MQNLIQQNTKMKDQIEELEDRHFMVIMEKSGVESET